MVAILSVGGNPGNFYAISASGLRDAALRMDVVANNVANGNTDGFVPDRVDSVTQDSSGVRGLVVMGNQGMLAPADPEAPSQTDYGNEEVNLIVARNAFLAGAKTIKAMRESEKALLDAFG